MNCKLQKNHKRSSNAESFYFLNETSWKEIKKLASGIGTSSRANIIITVIKIYGELFVYLFPNKKEDLQKLMKKY